MRARVKEVLFFINKVKFLKFQILLSALVKFTVKLLEFHFFLSLLLALHQAILQKHIDHSQMLYVFMLYGIYLAAQFCDTCLSHNISYHVIKKLRDNIFAHYYKISPGAVEDVKEGDFIQMIVNDINVFEWYIAHILTEWISLLFLSVAIAWRFFSNSLSAGIALTALMLYTVTGFLSTANTQEQQGIEIKNLGGALLANVIDGISGYKELKFFNKEKDFFRKIDSKSRAFNQIYSLYTLGELKTHLRADLGALLILPIIIASLHTDGIFWMKDITTIFLYCLIARNCLHQTGNYGFIFGAMHRLKRIYDIPPPVAHYGPLSLDASSGDWGIEFKNCDFSYNKNASKHILKNVSFTAKKGEKTVLVSASGGGKSTIFKLINRYYEAGGGEIFLFGKDITQYTEKTLRENITTFDQITFLFNDTVLNNLKYADKNMKFSQIEQMAKKLNALDFIVSKEKGFDTIVSEAGDNYSGGERQRLALLRGLLKDAPILLMDEVSSALDEQNSERLNDVLDDIKKHKVILMASHKLSTIKRADKIIFLKEGEVIQTGTYTELLTSDDFRKLLKHDKGDNVKNEY